MTHFKTIFHKNGTVTYWSVHLQGWIKHSLPEHVRDSDIAAMPFHERLKITSLKDKMRHRESEELKMLILYNAAPDLLEALEELYNSIDSCVELTSSLLNKVRGVIKKAKGDK